MKFSSDKVVFQPNIMINKKKDLVNWDFWKITNASETW